MSERFDRPLLSAALLVFTLLLPAYGARLSSSVSTRKLSVGDRVRLEVNLITAKNTAITPPATEEGFGNIIVKEWNVHKSEREKSDSSTYEYILTTYTPEPCTIPSLTFVLEHEGTTDTLHTDSIPMQIISILPSDTVDLMGLKPPLKAGKAPRWWIWLLGITAAIIALVVGGMYLAKRLRKVPPPPPPVPPYEEAIDALASLGVKKYLQRGLVREYVFELSEIFKRYVGRRFSCNAVEFTTEEMIAWSGAADLPKKQRASIEWFFRASDPVKFARMIPDTTTIDRFEPEVRDFLETTKPVVEQENAPGDAAEAATGNATEPPSPTAEKEKRG
ncbi:MAG: hypothetical protein JW863_24050 [Chitinispirillaceae bacterium]|nr:hypothetical protein [Chitinispirillaceae bacterium]